jgi:hypothetical protein
MSILALWALSGGRDAICDGIVFAKAPTGTRLPESRFP